MQSIKASSRSWQLTAWIITRKQISADNVSRTQFQFWSRHCVDFQLINSQAPNQKLEIIRAFDTVEYKEVVYP